MLAISSISTFFSIIFISLALGMNPAFADPPGWAPAHGYYKNKNQKKSKHKKQYHRSYDEERDKDPNIGSYEKLHCDPAGITNSDVGTVIGGVIGGFLGSRIGKGDGKTIATIAGVIVGANIGRSIGESMDEADRYCAGQALVHAQDKQPVEWTNPDSRKHYTVTPQRSYTKESGRYCRDYTSSVIINGQSEQATGTACRDNSGNWQIIS